MITRFRIYLIIAGLLLVMSFTGAVNAAGLVKTWEERTPADTPFSGVMFSNDSVNSICRGRPDICPLVGRR